MTNYEENGMDELYHQAKMRRKLGPKACKLCGSLNHIGGMCTNLQQVFLANCYVADNDPFYTRNDYQDSAHPRSHVTAVTLRSEKHFQVPRSEPSSSTPKEPQRGVPRGSAEGFISVPKPCEEEEKGESNPVIVPTLVPTPGAPAHTSAQPPAEAIPSPKVIPTRPFPKKKLKISTILKYKNLLKSLTSLVDGIEEIPAYTKLPKKVLAKKRSHPNVVQISAKIVAPSSPRKITIRDIVGIGPNEKIPYYEMVEREDPNTESLQEFQEEYCVQKSVMEKNQELMDAIERSIQEDYTVPELKEIYPTPKEEATHESTQVKEMLKEEPEVVAHRFPPHPSPFQVKAIPDDLEQPSFLFKYGVLAKWHVKDEETDISTPPPPHTKCEEETKPFVYGGEEAKEEPSKKRKRSTKEESPTSDCSKSFGSMFASLRRCHPPRAQEDEWMEEFGVHSGRFKLLASPIY
jgi:hypothetical protein